MPLFVKAGAIVPMQPSMGYAGERAVDPLTLDVYPSGRSSAVLYEDDGTSLEYQRGVFAITRLSCEETAASVTVRVAAPEGSYQVAPRAYEFRVRLDRAPRAVRLDGAAVPLVDPPPAGASPSAASWWFDAQARTLVVTTDPARKGLAARVEIAR
jgi:hypothetical protein